MTSHAFQVVFVRRRSRRSNPESLDRGMLGTSATPLTAARDDVF
ncbi:MAG: hypothetical protein QGI90_08060 [Nitrospinaceae bacterium]|nr:hypothetical protein [Nitrospinaceae bacterium]